MELGRDEGDEVVVQDRGGVGAGESGEGRRGENWYSADSCELCELGLVPQGVSQLLVVHGSEGRSFLGGSC